MKLVGKKFVLFDKRYDADINTYHPMFNDRQHIVGHQWIPTKEGKGFYVQLPIEKDLKDWKFATDLAHSTSKSIFARESLDKPLVQIIETRISPLLQNHVNRNEFTENETGIILDRQIRTILNIH